MAGAAVSHGRAGRDARGTYLLRVAVLAAAYYGAAKLGLSLAFTTPSVTAVWAPTGIALAAVVLWGPRVWPGIALGAFLANVDTDVPLYTTLGITLGNTLEALVGAFLLRRVAGFRPALDRVRDVLALVGLAAIASTMVSATIGVASLLAGNEIDLADAGVTWRTWWLGDMGGDLIVAPALLVAATHAPFRDGPGRLPEALAHALLIGGASALVFTTDNEIAFLVFPPLIVATMRFWQPGAVAGCLLIAAIAIPLTEAGHGPFAANTPDERLLLAQLLTGIASLTALLLAAVLSERHRAERSLAQIATTLQESLLPSRLPEVPGVETAIDYRPAGEGQIVGGDFYDLFATDGGWAVVVGDALGKGPTAAASTALARYTLRSAAARERRPSRILAELNDAIRREVDGQACTVALARLELRQSDTGGGATVTVASGGHPAPLVLRAYGGVELGGDQGLMLGVEPDALLGDHRLELAPGDALVLYTDGLTDAYAPRRVLSVRELAVAVRECAGLDAAAIAARLTRSLLDPAAGRPRDDILLFVLRIPPDPARPSASAGRETGSSPAPLRSS